MNNSRSRGKTHSTPHLRFNASDHNPSTKPKGQYSLSVQILERRPHVWLAVAQDHILVHLFTPNPLDILACDEFRGPENHGVPMHTLHGSGRRV